MQHSRGKAARHPCQPWSHHKTAGTWNDEEQRSASFQALGVQASALSAAGNLEKKREPRPARRHTHAHAGQNPTISRLAQEDSKNEPLSLEPPARGPGQRRFLPPPPSAAAARTGPLAPKRGLELPHPSPEALRLCRPRLQIEPEFHVDRVALEDLE